MTSLHIAWLLWALTLLSYVPLRYLKNKSQRYTAACLALAQGMLAGPILAVSPSIIAIVYVLTLPYVLTNTLRFVAQRMHSGHLARTSFRTYWLLSLWQLVILLFWQFPSLWPLRTDDGLLLGGVLSALLTLSWFWTGAIQSLQRKVYSAGEHYADRELPTVTVLVPARNETEQLITCLEAIVANDYPKLEVIVYDDCSQQKTSQIIKSFAQAGVRFVSGNEPPKTWLARNYALDTLADQANGSWLLCIGTDAVIEPTTIRTIVRVALGNKLDMLSILPRRTDTNLPSVIAEPIRYWWELSIRHIGGLTPPVSSDCWLIKRKSLDKLGGFNAVSRMLVPETYFATQLAQQHTYGCVQSTRSLGVRVARSTSSLVSGAIRLRYPQIRKQPVWVGAYSTIIMAAVGVPIGILVDATLTQSFGQLAWLALISYGALAASLGITTRSYNPKLAPIAALFAPLLFVLDVILLHISMWRYEFGTVLWRQRNICLPVMHVYPRLPKI